MNVLIEHNSGLARPSVCLSVFFVRLSRLGSSLENKNAHKKKQKMALRERFPDGPARG